MPGYNRGERYTHRDVLEPCDRRSLHVGRRMPAYCFQRNIVACMIILGVTQTVGKLWRHASGNQISVKQWTPPGIVQASAQNGIGHLDKYDSLTLPSLLSAPNPQVETSTFSFSLLPTSTEESYFNLKKRNHAIDQSYPAQGGSPFRDIKTTTESKMDDELTEKAIQNVILQTVPKAVQTRNRWATPMFNQQPTTAQPVTNSPTFLWTPDQTASVPQFIGPPPQRAGDPWPSRTSASLKGNVGELPVQDSVVRSVNRPGDPKGQTSMPDFGEIAHVIRTPQTEESIAESEMQNQYFNQPERRKKIDRIRSSNSDANLKTLWTENAADLSGPQMPLQQSSGNTAVTGNVNMQNQPPQQKSANAAEFNPRETMRQVGETEMTRHESNLPPPTSGIDGQRDSMIQSSLNSQFWDNRQSTSSPAQLHTSKNHKGYVAQGKKIRRVTAPPFYGHHPVLTTTVFVASTTSPLPRNSDGFLWQPDTTMTPEFQPPQQLFTNTQLKPQSIIIAESSQLQTDSRSRTNAQRGLNKVEELFCPCLRGSKNSVNNDRQQPGMDISTDAGSAIFRPAGGRQTFATGNVDKSLLNAGRFPLSTDGRRREQLSVFSRPLPPFQGIGFTSTSTDIQSTSITNNLSYSPQSFGSSSFPRPPFQDGATQIRPPLIQQDRPKRLEKVGFVGQQVNTFAVGPGDLQSSAAPNDGSVNNVVNTLSYPTESSMLIFPMTQPIPAVDTGLIATQSDIQSADFNNFTRPGAGATKLSNQRIREEQNNIVQQNQFQTNNLKHPDVSKATLGSGSSADFTAVESIPSLSTLSSSANLQDISRFAVGSVNEGSDMNKQLVMQVPLTDTFGQPVQTTTPSQWQPFTPRWSTTQTADFDNQVAFAGGQNQIRGTGSRKTLQQVAVDGTVYGPQPQTSDAGNVQQATQRTPPTAICPTATQPPITVDIIRPVRQYLLELLGPTGPICEKAVIPVQVDSSTVANTVIGTVFARDLANNTLLWSMDRDLSGAFGIDKFSGDVAVIGNLVGINSVDVVVRATNAAGQFCQTLIKVTVTRMERSQFNSWFSQDVYNVTVTCSLSNGALVMQVMAHHPRGEGLQFNLEGTSEFAVNNSGIVTVVGLDLIKPDPLRTFKITATDSKGNQASAWINVQLDMSTCYGPQFEMAAYIFDVETVDCSGVRPTDQISQIQALPPSPPSLVTYSLISTKEFTIDSMSGIISATVPQEKSQRLQDFGVVATDSYGRSDTATVQISVTVKCPSATPPSNLNNQISFPNTRKSPIELNTNPPVKEIKLGDFLLRVGCGTPAGTSIATLNPSSILALPLPVQNLRLVDTTDFNITPAGEIMTAKRMPDESSRDNFLLLGDGSPLGMGTIVGNVTVEVVCDSVMENERKRLSVTASSTARPEFSTFPFIPLFDTFQLPAADKV